MGCRASASPFPLGFRSSCSFAACLLACFLVPCCGGGERSHGTHVVVVTVRDLDANLAAYLAAPHASPWLAPLNLTRSSTAFDDLFDRVGDVVGCARRCDGASIGLATTLCVNHGTVLSSLLPLRQRALFPTSELARSVAMADLLSDPAFRSADVLVGGLSMLVDTSSPRWRVYRTLDDMRGSSMAVLSSSSPVLAMLGNASSAHARSCLYVPSSVSLEDLSLSVLLHQRDHAVSPSSLTVLQWARLSRLVRGPSPPSRSLVLDEIRSMSRALNVLRASFPPSWELVVVGTPTPPSSSPLSMQSSSRPVPGALLWASSDSSLTTRSFPLRGGAVEPSIVSYLCGVVCGS